MDILPIPRRDLRYNPLSCVGVRLRGTFSRAQRVLAGGESCKLRKFWARDTLLLDKVQNAQLLKAE